MTAQPGPRRVVVSLGSNLGDRLGNLQAAIDVLCGPGGLHCRAISPVYRTRPVGGPEQDDYLNAVLTAETTLQPRAVLGLCQQAERARGRVRAERWGPRTLDADVICYGGEVSSDPRLTLPHPRAHQRAFVLAPWHDIEPEAELPRHGPVAALLAAAGTDGVRLLPDAALHLPPRQQEREEQ
ncbi:MAG TPA: 2-amino-4-hydroxy-6-hydroxymethyldihydropteridine diphosphokinase [Streptosporangiaceae bacterium]